MAPLPESMLRSKGFPRLMRLPAEAWTTPSPDGHTCKHVERLAMFGVAWYFSERAPSCFFCCCLEVTRQRLAGVEPLRDRSTTKTTEDFIDDARRIHGETYGYDRSQYVNSITPLTITCPVHGDFQQRPNAHLVGKGCAACRESKGERTVRRFLVERGEPFVPQWRPQGCVFKRQLSFDFHLPARNVAIEFDGAQHRVPVVWPGRTQKDADMALAAIQARDAFKDDWATRNGVRLVRIGRVEDIESILSELLASGAASAA